MGLKSTNVSLWRPPRNPPKDPYADIITLLANVLTNSTKLEGAACITAPDLFSADATTGEHQQATQICLGSCPALDACRAWATTLPHGHVSGVVAGEIHKPKYPLNRKEHTQ